MERNLRVMKDGYLLAEIKFVYEGQTSGKAFVTVYGSYDIDDDEHSKSVYPKWTDEKYLRHRELKSIAEIKAFDQTFVKNECGLGNDLTGKIEFVYDDQVHYRYVLSSPRETLGFVDIMANFNEDKKELQFFSTKRIKDDFQLASNSAEANIPLMKRLGEQYWLDFLLYVDYKEVESWYA